VSLPANGLRNDAEGSLSSKAHETKRPFLRPQLQGLSVVMYGRSIDPCITRLRWVPTKGGLNQIQGLVYAGGTLCRALRRQAPSSREAAESTAPVVRRAEAGDLDEMGGEIDRCLAGALHVQHQGLLD